MATNRVETAKWQTKADAATRTAGAGDVTVLLARRAGYGGVYYYQTRTLEVDPIGRDPRDVERTFAHELSHHLLGHRSALLEQEIAANAHAIPLMVSWGWTEENAVLWWERSRLSSKQAGSGLAGHDWCAEYADLVRRYPQYRQTRYDSDTLCGGVRK
jgi:hypothetical protein